MMQLLLEVICQLNGILRLPKLSKAFQSIAKSKEGHNILNSLYGYEGFSKINDKSFNGVREHLKEAKNIDK